MGQYLKNQIIYFQYDNISSIREALQQYQELLNNRSAIDNKGFHMEFDVKFMENSGHEPRNIKLSDIKDFSLFKKAICLRSQFYAFLEKETILREEDAVYLSETLLFSLALEHSELKEEVIKTAKAIADMSRYYNDSGAMWLNENGTYGADALYLLATHDINYAYLLAQFLIPYWDERYTVNYEVYLFDLLQQHGWNRALMKAYLYCDNTNFRAEMMCREGEESNKNMLLSTYLKENVDEYEWFKKAIKARLLDEPMLYYKGEGEKENPVLSLYLTLGGEKVYEDDDDYTDYFSNFFIEDTIENEATDLYEKILSSTIKPLMRLDGESQKEKEAREYTDNAIYEAGESIMHLRPFILSLESGEKLWEYIEKGTQKKSLEQLTEIDVMQLVKEASPAFYHNVNYFLDKVDDEGNPMPQNKGIVESLEQCFRYLIDDLTLFNGESFYVDNIPQAFNPISKNRAEVRYHQLLRILDIFFILFGKKTFTFEMYERLIDEEEEENFSITEEAFFKRYSGDNNRSEGTLPQRVEKQIASIVEEFSTIYDRDSIDTDLLRKLDKCLATSRECYNVKFLEPKTAGTYAMSAYLLKLDAENGIEDDYTIRLRQYIQESPWEGIAKLFTDKGYHADPMPKEVKEKIEDYFCNTNHPKSTEEEIILLLNENLNLYEEKINGEIIHKFSKNQRAYDLLRFNDFLPKFVQFSFWAQTLPIYNEDQRAKRFWKLMVAIAPFWTIERILRTVSTQYGELEFETPKIEQTFFQSLADVGVEDSLLFAFEVMKSQDFYSNNKVKQVSRYLPWINAYNLVHSSNAAENPMYDFMKYKVDKLKEGLKYINGYNYIQFYRDLAVSKSSNTFTCEEEFKECLRSFFIMNWKGENLENIDDLIEGMIDYIDGKLAHATYSAKFWSNIAIKRVTTKRDGQRSATLQQFFWGLNKNRQDRLIQLLMHQSYAAFQLLFDGVERAYQEELIVSGALKFKDFIDPNNRDKEDEHDFNAYTQFLIRIEKLGVDNTLLIKYCIAQTNKAYSNYLGKIGRRGQLNSIISDLSYSEKNNLLDHFENQSGNVQLLSLLQEDPSRKIRDKVTHILNQFNKVEEESTPSIIDFGLYQYSSSGVQFIKETDRIVAKVNSYFGFQFHVKEDLDSNIINHTVHAFHPVLKEGEKELERSEWTQQGEKGKPIFVGWNFEKEEELLTGEYTFKVYDWQRNLLAEKTFLVESAAIAEIIQNLEVKNEEDTFYHISIPKLEGICIAEGEELLRENCPVVFYNPVEFDGFGISTNDLTAFIQADYPLILEELVLKIAKHRPFGCYFIPAVITTKEGEKARYYVLKTILSIDQLEVSQNKLIAHDSANRTNLIVHQKIKNALSEQVSDNNFSVLVENEMI